MTCTGWTDESIKKGIRDVMNGYCLERMPSRSEIELFYGDSKLSNAIMKRGGFYEWAKRLNISTKDCETKLGIEAEGKVKTRLETMGFESVELTPVRHPYDILVNHRVKIDVKISHKYEYGHGTFYSFGLAKPMQTCDVFIAIALDDNKTYVIPSSILNNKKQLSIGMTSKYDKYINRWDIVQKLDDCFRAVESV